MKDQLTVNRKGLFFLLFGYPGIPGGRLKQLDAAGKSGRRGGRRGETVGRKMLYVSIFPRWERKRVSCQRKDAIREEEQGDPHSFIQE